MSIIRTAKTKLKDKQNEKAIKKVKLSEKYINNQSQIDIIKEVLTKHADVPEELINNLIKATEENAILLYEATHKKNEN